MMTTCQSFRLFSGRRVGIHHAFPLSGPGDQADGGVILCSGAPVCCTDGWRRPAQAGRKAVKCPMVFLIEEAVS